MRLARIRTAAFAVLFLGWVGYLGLLAVDAKTPVLSRSQVMASDVLVAADVAVGGDGLPEEEVTVREVLAGPAGALKPGAKFRVAGLKSGRVQYAEGFPGAGEYLIPLRREGDGYGLTSSPPSPGAANPPRQPWVYAMTESIRRQAEGFTPAAR